MEKDIAVKIGNVSKTFNLHANKKYTLRSLVASLFNQGDSENFKALSDINLEIKKGEFVGIIGRNGSGKSTLLKLIAGIYRPDKKGIVKVNGRLVPFLELGVGFNTELTGRENIFLNGTILGMTRKYIESKFDEIVSFAELEKFIDTPVKNYSSGMQVRLAFSIAIQSDADIYILDEILSVGDVIFQKKSLRVINDFKAKGKTVLYVSHSMGDVEKYCDRAILLENGKLTADGAPHKIVEKYSDRNDETLQKEFDSKFNKSAKTFKKTQKIKEDVTFKKVTLKGEEKDSTIVLNTGEDIELEIEVEKNTILKDPTVNFHVGIHSIEDSATLAVFTTKFDGIKFDINTQNKIKLVLQNNKLNKGNYYISALLYGYDYDTKYDVLPFAEKFKIENNNFQNGDQRRGRILLDYKWDQTI